MYDKQNKPVQYYFDVNLRNITQLGNARTLDLCLDVLVIPKSGEYELVDEDDLERMLKEKKISKPNSIRHMLQLMKLCLN